MATTPATGVDGNVSFGTHYAAYNSWTLTVSQALVDVTAYGDTYAAHVGGLKFGSWTIGGTLKYDAASHSPNLEVLEKTGITGIILTVATGCTYTFTGIPVSATASSDVGGGARVTWSGVTSGAITEAWDESA
jgi:hypothetical protein